MEYHLAGTRSGALAPAAAWMHLDSMVLRDRGRTRKATQHGVPPMGSARNRRLRGDRQQTGGCRGAGGGERSDCSTAQGFLPGSGNVLELDVVEAAPPCECTKCRWIVHVKIVHFNVHSMNFV